MLATTASRSKAPATTPAAHRRPGARSWAGSSSMVIGVPLLVLSAAHGSGQRRRAMGLGARSGQTGAKMWPKSGHRAPIGARDQHLGKDRPSKNSRDRTISATQLWLGPAMIFLAAGPCSSFPPLRGQAAAADHQAAASVASRPLVFGRSWPFIRRRPPGALVGRCGARPSSASPLRPCPAGPAGAKMTGPSTRVDGDDKGTARWTTPARTFGGRRGSGPIKCPSGDPAGRSGDVPLRHPVALFRAPAAEDPVQHGDRRGAAPTGRSPKYNASMTVDTNHGVFSQRAGDHDLRSRRGTSRPADVHRHGSAKHDASARPSAHRQPHKPDEPGAVIRERAARHPRTKHRRGRGVQLGRQSLHRADDE